MDEILAYLTHVPAWYLATSEDGQPHVRPFSFAAKEDGKIWFVTATYKDVYEELVANPKMEGCSWWVGHGWLVFSGEAVFGDVSEEMRVAAYEHLTGLGEDHDGPDDPRLAFFHVDHMRARIDDIDGSHRQIEL
ncbi:pyridoxamine 5'-phosphate oxidase family protein [bacterium]|nr:pyridoxamine 5'-phosphate oxidase family protein [bacterium]